jgi:hypothetical protein
MGRSIVVIALIGIAIFAFVHPELVIGEKAKASPSFVGPRIQIIQYPKYVNRLLPVLEKLPFPDRNTTPWRIRMSLAERGIINASLFSGREQRFGNRPVIGNIRQFVDERLFSNSCARPKTIILGGRVAKIFDVKFHIENVRIVGDADMNIAQKNVGTQLPFFGIFSDGNLRFSSVRLPFSFVRLPATGPARRFHGA